MAKLHARGRKELKRMSKEFPAEGGASAFVMTFAFFDDGVVLFKRAVRRDGRLDTSHWKVNSRGSVDRFERAQLVLADKGYT